MAVTPEVDKVVVLPEEVTSPVRLALVVTVAAFPPIFRFVTGVDEVTTSGAVPVATVEVNDPLTLRLVPVAAPMTGVTKVGEVSITNFEPVPVWEATDVVLPILVIGPVKFALVAAITPVNLAPLPTNPVAAKIPVLGTKDNFVPAVF